MSFQGPGGSTSRFIEFSQSITLIGSDETKVQDIFKVIGSVEVREIWGEVKTAIGANHTRGHLLLQPSGTEITVDIGGATLSAMLAGTLLIKDGLAAVALSVENNSVDRVKEQAVAGE